MGRLTVLLWGMTSLLFVVHGDESQAPVRDNFELPCVSDDSLFRLKDHQGKFVVVHFLLKTECPLCLRLTRDYAKVAAEESDVVHIFVKPDAEEDLREWMDHLDPELRTELPRICRDADARLAKLFRIPDGYRFHGQTVHYPALVILGPDRREVFRHVGKSNQDRYPIAEYQKTISDLRKSAAGKMRGVAEPQNSVPIRVRRWNWAGLCCNAL